MQAFVCTSTAAFTMQLLAHGSFSKATSALLGGHMVLADEYRTQDIPIIVFIGLVTGFLSAAIVLTCKQVYVWRKRFEKKVGSKRGALVNVIFLTMLAVATSVFIPLAFSCSPDAEYGRRQLGANTSRQLLSMTGSMQYTCANSTHNPMALYMHSGPEANIVMLWSSEKHYDTVVLLVLLLSYTLQMVLLPGMLALVVVYAYAIA